LPAQRHRKQPLAQPPLRVCVPFQRQQVTPRPDQQNECTSSPLLSLVFRKKHDRVCAIGWARQLARWNHHARVERRSTFHKARLNATPKTAM
jgi:hypothetical protein